MATVAADAILGLTAGRALRLSKRWTLYLIAMANLPDADYLPGLLVGDPASTHRNIWMHTPYFAVAVGFLVTGAHLAWHRGKDIDRRFERAAWIGAVSTLMVLGHLVLDMLELPYWHQTGWMALPAEAVNSVVDAAVLGPVALGTFWIWDRRFRSGFPR